jgi:hypothetical protein
MAKNNNVLYNAALAGAVAGMNQAWISNPLASSYAVSVAASAAFATEVDAQIPNDAQISAAGGAALPPTTDSIQTFQLAKTGILKDICQAVWAGRTDADPVAVDYLTIAVAIAALYTEAVAQIFES